MTEWTEQTRQTCREALAEYAHEAWSGWMKYLFGKTETSERFFSGEIVVVIPRWAVDRWQRQMNTPYADLPESEKESDRAEADKMLAILAALDEPPTGWQPVGEKFILTHDTGLIGMPKQFVRWNADDQSILVGADDGNFHHCPLPDDIRLCRLSPQPQQQGLDFPDSPGWWAFEGKWTDQEHDKVWQYVFLVEEKEGVLYAVIANDLELPSTLIGKWFRLYMPWEQPQPPAVPTMPSEVREVLTTAMDNLYVDLEFEAIVLAPRIAQNMDAAYAWLDAHSPQEVIK